MSITDFLGPIQTIEKNKIPKYDFHMHTTWTDGTFSAQQMYDQAVANGLEGILFSEHARKSSGDWFGNFANEVRALPEKPCKALVGVETKVINFEGDIDLTKEIIDQADLVMASVHRFPGEQNILEGTKEYTFERAIDIEFRLAMGVLENPHVDILGHLFGMAYRRFGFSPPESKILEIISKAAVTGVAIEINTHYHPNPWTLIDWCKKAGARISLGSNAHSLDAVSKVIRILDGKEKPWSFKN